MTTLAKTKLNLTRDMMYTKDDLANTINFLNQELFNLSRKMTKVHKNKVMLMLVESIFEARAKVYDEVQALLDAYNEEFGFDNNYCNLWDAFREANRQWKIDSSLYI